MSSLLSRLPSELLSKIFTLLLPNEVLVLTLCCKSLAGLGKSSLRRHKELSQRYKVLYLGYSVEVGGLWSPIVLLVMIMNDPNITYYPRIVQLLEYSHDELDDDSDKDEERNWLEGRAKEQKIVEKWGGFREFVESESSLSVRRTEEVNDREFQIAPISPPMSTHPGRPLCSKMGTTTTLSRCFFSSFLISEKS